MCDFTEREQLTVDQIYLLLACFAQKEKSKYFRFWRRRNRLKYNGGGKRVKYIPRKIQQIKSIRLSKVVRNEFSTDECIANPCIVAINIDKEFHINATVLNFKYFGDDQESSSCRYGGLVSIEKIDYEYKEGLAFCKDNFIVSRSFYSMYSNLIFVIYSYEGYSNIKATFLLSKTKCKPQGMNALAIMSNLDLLWMKQRSQMVMARYFLLQQMNNSTSLKLFTQDDEMGTSHNSFYISGSADACVILLFSLADTSFHYADLLSHRKKILQLILAPYPDKHIDKMIFIVRGTFQQTHYNMFKYIQGRGIECMYYPKHQYPCNAKIGKFYPSIHDIEYFVVENINKTDEFFYHKNISKYLHPITIQNPFKSSDKHSIVGIIKKMFLSRIDTFMGLSNFMTINQSLEGVIHFIIRATITPSRHSLTFRMILNLFLVTHSWLHIAVYHQIEENSNVQNDAQIELENQYISKFFYQKQKYKPNLGQSNIYVLHLKLHNIKQPESKFVVQTFFKTLSSKVNLVKTCWKFTSYFMSSSRSRFISLSIGAEEVQILFEQTKGIEDKSVYVKGTWIDDMYEKYYHFLKDSAQKCSQKISTNFTFCLNFSSFAQSVKTRHYIFLGNLIMDPSYFSNHYAGVTLKNEIDLIKLKNGLRERIDIVESQKSLSWEEASQLCRDARGYLPYFTSRDELEEFIAFIKLEKYGILVNALFIGLHNKKVRSCLLAC